MSYRGGKSPAGRETCFDDAGSRTEKLRGYIVLSVANSTRLKTSKERSKEGALSEAEGSALPTLSVIVPVYNAGVALSVQLAALAAQHYEAEWETVIVDNGSTDGSAELARRFVAQLPNLRIVTSTAGKGPAFARNVGASVATGDALIFVDQDDEVAPGYINAMGHKLATCEFVGARVDHKTLNPQLLVEARFPWQSDDLMRGGFLPATSGCALGIRRGLFEVLGGFDERFLYAQDIELSWRAQLAGTELCFVPDAILHYRHRRDLFKHVQQEYFWGTDDALIYRTFRFAGMPRRTVRASLSEWRQISREVLKVKTVGDMLRVISKSARRIGHLRGSIKHQVWFP